jgi:hypothetical protein
LLQIAHLTLNLFYRNVQNNTEGQEISKPESSDDRTSYVWFKIDHKPKIKHFILTAVLHIVIDNPESVVPVMRSINIPQQLRTRTFRTS